MCHHMKMVETFKSSIAGKLYKLKATAKCKTSNVVDVIKCNCCRRQYMGETENALDISMKSYRSDINHQHLKNQWHNNSTLLATLWKIFLFFSEDHRVEATLLKVK